MNVVHLRVILADDQRPMTDDEPEADCFIGCCS